MAKGSERFAWSQFPGIPHICDFCKRPLRVQDVGEYRATYDTQGKRTIVFWCSEHRGGRERG